MHKREPWLTRTPTILADVCVIVVLCDMLWLKKVTTAAIQQWEDMHLFVSTVPASLLSHLELERVRSLIKVAPQDV